MLEIISFNNEHITIKVKKNKKEILNALGITDINNTNEFKIFNTPFALEILLKYTNNNDNLKHIYKAH
ncbi:hypothetical protein [Spiroplasma endosymbiont of Danaus chrysippus]|uniref:hypothetical protein n=1 Tax=Spiroplasma endosymbiont of Danaus chrysippus TaxID=2691041 RepID=UPI00157A229A|nr:hypothetical protein [Spiroplasma endosymbiont of Danaus chrysippus]